MRRPATVFAVALVAATVLAGPADAKAKAVKAPVVTSVTPLAAVVGQQLVLRGRHFRPGRGRNGVGLKADGKPIVFLRSGLSTRRMMTVPLTDALAKALAGSPRRFRLRVLTSRFGKRYTSMELSPTIGPAPAQATAPAKAPAVPATTTALPPAAALPSAPAGGCSVTANGDGDQDGDRLPDGLELRIGTDGCAADSDGDGVEDGYEYRSAIDLNDDEYQRPNQTLPFPAKRPYPNPLDASDAGTDFDGDLLTLREEYALWLAGTPAAQRRFTTAGSEATPLSYSDGLQYSVSVRDAGNRRVPALTTAADTAFPAFFAWATAHGADTVALQTDPSVPWYDHAGRTTFDIRDTNFSGAVSLVETNPLDFDTDGFLSDDERDGDVDGLSNYQELHGAMRPGYWSTCYPQEDAYPVAFAGTDAADPDTDGDGVLDGADDQDFDDYPNVMELSRIRASGFDDTNGRVCTPKPALTTVDASTGRLPLNHPEDVRWLQPFNPCLPMASRSCNKAYLDSYAGPIWWALQ